jgi:MoaA/NifB/PqqE/SkfB family radical SAM enzyme
VITFCGGEPLLVRRLPELAALIRDRGKRTVLNTNGELLRRRFGDGSPMPFDVVGISLDGPDEPTHRAMRGADADFAESVSAAGWVIGTGAQLKIGTIVSAVNADRLVRLAALIRTLRPVTWRLYQYSPWGPQSRGHARHSVDAEAFGRTVAALSEAAAPVPVVASSTDTTGGCFIVDPGGTILRPDGTRYVPLGNCLEEPIDDLWAREPRPHEVTENKRWHLRLAEPVIVEG